MDSLSERTTQTIQSMRVRDMKKALEDASDEDFIALVLWWTKSEKGHRDAIVMVSAEEYPDHYDQAKQILLIHPMF